jgi:hypothetical protein
MAKKMQILPMIWLGEVADSTDGRLKSYVIGRGVDLARNGKRKVSRQRLRRAKQCVRSPRG